MKAGSSLQAILLLVVAATGVLRARVDGDSARRHVGHRYGRCIVVGLLLAVRGVRDLGTALTPLPHPLRRTRVSS